MRDEGHSDKAAARCDQWDCPLKVGVHKAYTSLPYDACEVCDGNEPMTASDVESVLGTFQCSALVTWRRDDEPRLPARTQHIDNFEQGSLGTIKCRRVTHEQNRPGSRSITVH